MQVLIRQLQEMWLFGQLNTIGESKVQQQANENAKAVADLLKQLVEKQQTTALNGFGDGAPNEENQAMTNGS